MSRQNTGIKPTHNYQQEENDLIKLSQISPNCWSLYSYANNEDHGVCPSFSYTTYSLWKNSFMASKKKRDDRSNW